MKVVKKEKAEELMQVDLGLWLKRGGCCLCEWPPACCLLPPLGFSLWRCKGRWGSLGEIAHVTSTTAVLTTLLFIYVWIRREAFNGAKDEAKVKHIRS